jgi:hypothetical protein
MTRMGCALQSLLFMFKFVREGWYGRVREGGPSRLPASLFGLGVVKNTVEEVFRFLDSFFCQFCVSGGCLAFFWQIGVAAAILGPPARWGEVIVLDAIAELRVFGGEGIAGEPNDPSGAR